MLVYSTKKGRTERYICSTAIVVRSLIQRRTADFYQRLAIDWKPGTSCAGAVPLPELSPASLEVKFMVADLVSDSFFSQRLLEQKSSKMTLFQVIG